MLSLSKYEPGNTSILRQAQDEALRLLLNHTDTGTHIMRLTAVSRSGVIAAHVENPHRLNHKPGDDISAAKR